MQTLTTNMNLEVAIYLSNERTVTLYPLYVIKFLFF